MLSRTVHKLSAVSKQLFNACQYSTAKTSQSIMYENAKTKIKLARRFGREGLKSGVDIRKLWPTVEEINEINELRLYKTAQEARTIAEEMERKKIEATVEREHQIDERLKNST